MWVSFCIAKNLQIADSEQKVVVGNFLIVKPSELLEADDGQTGVEGIQLADLDVSSVQVVRVVSKIGQSLVAEGTGIFGGVISGPEHATERRDCGRAPYRHQ